LARNPKIGESITKEILEAAPKVEVTFLERNLRSLVSIQGSTKQILASTQRLDILFCNAGIYNSPPSLIEDEYEIQFGVNHLGHALLIKLLFPLLLKTTGINPDV
jgi:NAD(P)-dependent dehydrogenase (short-subunit alcohol dehydrogenase family)